jgi:hypothetical protein
MSVCDERGLRFCGIDAGVGITLAHKIRNLQQEISYHKVFRSNSRHLFQLVYRSKQEHVHRKEVQLRY